MLIKDAYRFRDNARKKYGELFDTIERLNWHHGRGDVIDLCFGHAIRWIPTTPSSGFIESRNYRHVGIRSVRAFGHQAVIRGHNK